MQADQEIEATVRKRERLDILFAVNAGCKEIGGDVGARPVFHHQLRIAVSGAK
jgi:hypothetical protein